MVLDDIKLRIYFEKHDTKKRCLLATVIWIGLVCYLVMLRKKYEHVQPFMAYLCFSTYAFTSIFVFGAFAASDVHMNPEMGVPKALLYEMRDLLIFLSADAANILLYLIQSNTFKVYNLMRWLIFGKLFFAAYLFIEWDNRHPELLVCLMLTTFCSYLTACTIRRIINEEEKL